MMRNEATHTAMELGRPFMCLVDVFKNQKIIECWGIARHSLFDSLDLSLCPPQEEEKAAAEFESILVQKAHVV